MAAEHHEGGGIGIGGDAVGRNDGGREHVLLYGTAGDGVDGVGEALSVLIVEVAIVAAGGYSAVGQVHDILQARVDLGGVLLWLVDAYAPEVLAGIEAAAVDLAADLDHVVLDAFGTEEVGHHVAHVALGDAREVEADARIVLDDMAIIVNAHFLVADEGLDAVDHLLRDVLAVLEAEAPQVDQRSAGDVEGAMRDLTDLEGTGQDGAQEGVDHDGGVVVVDAGDERGVVEHGDGAVELAEHLVDLRGEVGGMVVLDMVDGVEHRAFQLGEFTPGRVGFLLAVLTEEADGEHAERRTEAEQGFGDCLVHIDCRRGLEDVIRHAEGESYAGAVRSIAWHEDRLAQLGARLREADLPIEVPTEGNVAHELHFEHHAGLEPVGLILLIEDRCGAVGSPEVVGIVEVGDVGLVVGIAIAQEHHVEVGGSGAVVVEIVAESDLAEGRELGLEVELLLLVGAVVVAVVRGLVGPAHAQAGHGEEAVMEVDHDLAFIGGMLEVEEAHQRIEDVDADAQAVEEGIAVFLAFGQDVEDGLVAVFDL